MQLTPEQRAKAEEIYVKTFDEVSFAQIAKVYNVSRMTIHKIALKYDWKNKRKEYQKSLQNFEKVDMSNQDFIIYELNQRTIDNIKLVKYLKGLVVEQINEFKQQTEKNLDQLTSITRISKDILEMEDRAFSKIDTSKYENTEKEYIAEFNEGLVDEDSED